MTQRATKVGGRLHGRKSELQPDRAQSEDRASGSLTHGAGADASRPSAPFRIAKRAVPLEIDKVQLDFRPATGAKDALMSAMRDNRYAAWRMVAKWMAWHEMAGTAERLRAGESCGAFPSAEILEWMYRAGCIAAPRVAPLCVQQTKRWLEKTMKQQTSPKSSLPRWQAVLLGAEDWWGFGVSNFGGAPKPDEKLPLRVYSQLASVERRDGHLWVCLNCVRGDDGKRLPLTLRVARPHGKANGRKLRQWSDAVNALALIADGNVSMPGCQIVSRGRKLFFALTREAQFEPIEPAGKRLILRASRRAALHARVPGKTRSGPGLPDGELLGSGELLALGKKRRAFIASRGHATRDGKAWYNYCTTLAHRLANEIVAAAEKHGVGEVIVLAGRGDSALDLCGIEEDREARERTRFPMQNFQVILSQKLEPRGVNVITRANYRSVKRRKQRRRNELEAKQVREAAG